MCGVVDPAQDAVGAPAGAPQALQIVAQGHADPPGVLQQRPGDQLDDRGRDRLGQVLGDSRSRRSCDDYLVRATVTHEGRSARTASVACLWCPRMLGSNRLVEGWVAGDLGLVAAG